MVKRLLADLDSLAELSDAAHAHQHAIRFTRLGDDLFRHALLPLYDR